MSAVIPREVVQEILAKVGDAAARTPLELDAIAAEYGLMLKELGELLDKAAAAKARAAATPRKRCSRCGETKPLSEFYSNTRTSDGVDSGCRTCNNTRPHTETRLLRNRARSRAYAQLAEAHREEFERLYAVAYEETRAEHERLVEKAAAKGHADAPVARIKRGPKRREETDVLQRLDVARCPECHTHHDAGHVCPSCGSETAETTPEGSRAS